MYHVLQVPEPPWPDSKSLLGDNYFSLPKRLEHLSLRNSRILYDFSDTTFCGDNLLQTVKLDHNAISKWKSPLRGLNKLQHVNLSVNLCENSHDD